MAFKQKVVREIEDGKLSQSGACKLYNLKGGSTLPQWIKKIGKNHLLNKIVRIELTDEVNMLKQKEKEKRELESAFAQAHLKIMSLELQIY